MKPITTTEKLSDVSDLATNLETLEMETTLAAHRSAMARQAVAPLDWDKSTCYDCGDTLSQFRVETNRYRCVPCQTLVEKKQKGY